MGEAASQNAFDRPVFIVAAPRSGSTLLFEILAHARALWTIGGESHTVFESIPSLQVGLHAQESNRLTAMDANPHVAAQLRSQFLDLLVSSDRKSYRKSSSKRVRMLEKTPKNALRIPFLNAVFPDARYIFLYRDPRANISSIIDGWRSGGFIMYRDLPEWDGTWSFMLPPGYGDLRGKPIEEVAAFQWRSANATIVGDLAAIPRERWITVNYDALIAHPLETIRRLCAFAQIKFDDELLRVTTHALPLSRYTLTPPTLEKWKKNADLIARVLPGVSDVAARIERFAVQTGDDDRIVQRDIGQD